MASNDGGELLVSVDLSLACRDIWEVTSRLLWQFQADPVFFTAIFLRRDVYQHSVVVRARNANRTSVTLPVIYDIERTYSKLALECAQHAVDRIILIGARPHIHVRCLTFALSRAAAGRNEARLGYRRRLERIVSEHAAASLDAQSGERKGAGCTPDSTCPYQAVVLLLAR